jgi:F-box and WD-40 domain protein CDC4
MQAHRVPVTNPESGVVTSVALDQDWVVVGLANCRIHVFSAKTGVLSRTLIGHDSGVWAVHLVSSGGYWDPGPEKKRPPSQRVEPVAHPRARPCRSRSQSVGDIDSLGAELAATCVNVDRSASSSLAGSSHFHAHHPSELGLDGWGSLPSSSSSARWRRCASSGDAAGLPHPLREGVGRPSDLCSASEGWGQPSALVVSGGCDKVLRVWDVKTGWGNSTTFSRLSYN